ncbi:ABC transporter ATP-binding protein [Saccharopolyspora erythraea]|uniref:dipeptide ABC transporter ATP-binding protein n=1 Tax=Saccharopolyspora erythraea TaxID=1836 RepID=UPI001BAE3307|nr:ABC transporter ATP-binding protein [Saccharopolyspora erythraea]QUH03899.1 ABC transporter ATP-binding protein [Saccharopolyspora erythraea]
MSIVDVRDLSIAYRAGRREVPVVRDVSLSVEPGQTLALVGESGSGKSTIAGTLLGHLRHGSRQTAGEVRIDGEDVFSLSGKRLRALRGRTAAMVAQNAGSALTPSMRIGRQLDEVLHGQGLTAAARRSRALELLDQVRLPEPDSLVKRYAHQLSGGQQQRVAIAMAIAARPKVLVLDEPTTGLDVITQRGILDLLSALADELSLATVLVSHDLGVVAAVADHVHVLRAGRTVESAPSRRLFSAPAEPYTRQLLASVPRISDRGLVEVGADGERHARPRAEVADAEPVVDLDEVRVGYGKRTVVSDVSLQLRRGEVLALVGESGSGKSTLAASLAGLRAPASGRVRYLGETPGDLRVPAGKRPRDLRRKVQLVFQNADTALNPRRSIRDSVRRPLRLFGIVPRAQRATRTTELIESVRLDAALAERLPAQLSGGQRQRVGIARALAGAPEVIIADEITTALDVSVQAQVLALLDDLRREHRLACLFISHDLAVVRGMADRVVVLHQGRVVEQGSTEAVFAGPNHPYTRALLDAALEPDPQATGTAGPAPAWAHDDHEETWTDAGEGHLIRRWKEIR